MSITDINAVAIMTDTDKTGAATQAYFTDIWLNDR